MRRFYKAIDPFEFFLCIHIMSCNLSYLRLDLVTHGSPSFRILESLSIDYLLHVINHFFDIFVFILQDIFKINQLAVNFLLVFLNFSNELSDIILLRLQLILNPTLLHLRFVNQLLFALLNSFVDFLELWFEDSCKLVLVNWVFHFFFGLKYLFERIVVLVILVGLVTLEPIILFNLLLL